MTSRLPWQDRWSQPSLKQLLEPLKAQHRKLFEMMIHQLDPVEGVQRNIIYYGSAWNWTVQYQTVDNRGRALETLCYMVPKLETPIICIPLGDAAIERLPVRRLNKFVRDGIKMAKCAVAIHWATWTPNSQAEIGFLMDLLKRKLKLQHEPAALSA